MADRPPEGKVAVVTGASRDVGRAVASNLAALGASVVVTAGGVPRHDLPGTVGELVSDIEASGGSAVAIAADLPDAADVDRLAADVLQRFGRVDMLVNNAAVDADLIPFQRARAVDLDQGVRGGDAAAGEWADLQRQFAVARLDGDILPICPGVGGLNAYYPATKAALNQLTPYVGNELRAVGVTMISIDPGFTASEQAVHTLYTRHPKDVADAVIPDAQPVEVTAAAIAFIATSADPSPWATKVVVARQLVDEHHLLDIEMGRGTAVAITP